jgi:protein-S-isoprenylcysteine O-methyltransferase Ste14
MVGLILSLRSPLGWLVLLERWHHFSSRVTEDEERLQRLFGAEYQSYRSEVPRWLPGLR